MTDMSEKTVVGAHPTAPTAPLVSVVLPTYNRSAMLPGAIESILSQTYCHLELIIVDDCSPDDTPAVVARYKDPRLRYFRNEQNSKLPRTLNRGFAEARGAYLTWTSDDNLYCPDAIEKMVDWAQLRHCDFVYADYFHFTEQDPKTGQPQDPAHVRLPDRLQLERCNQVGACFLYSRAVYEQIGDYDPELFLIEDYDYFIRTFKVFGMEHLAEPLYYFRRHEDSLYCSRYFEVKAADLLVRYKNDLLSREHLLDAATKLVLGNVEMLRSPLLRFSLAKIKGASYRLALLYQRLLAAYLNRRLSGRIGAILNRYDARQINFRNSRDDLVNLLSGVVNLEYKR